jgi:RNA polymerase sigma-70 factor (ECF subfamily)
MIVMSAIQKQAEQPKAVNALWHKQRDALRAYDETLFIELVDRYQMSMLRIARRYVANVETAQEVVQETWVAVVQGAEKFEGRASLKTWLFAILINRARTRSKQEQRFVPLAAWDTVDDDESPAVTANGLRGEGQVAGVRPPHPPTFVNAPEEQVLAQEVQTLIAEAIRTLPDSQRMVMILRDLEGWSAEEICLALGLSEGNQRVLLHRARRKVRRLLEAYDIHEPPIVTPQVADAC